MVSDNYLGILSVKFMKNLVLISIFIILTNIVNASENHDHDHDSNHKHEHKHKMIKAEKPYPTLSFELFEDKMDGFNLIINTSNFIFSPQNVNEKNNGNEGHAHIYINGTKFRQYSPYFHIPSRLLQNGKNIIKITLNSNDHGHFMADKVPLTKKIEIDFHKHH